ncbi:MAG: undecaprenyl-diphosphate phosphatase [Armatimonadetes bacterium]|nr:undecaprenyl-diphosphate phosphatase [Armatimonadota bacterium]
MNAVLQLVILGVVQGLTEFLPVSSSAHLVFAEYFLGVKEQGVALVAALHLGTVLAVVALYWRDLGMILGRWLRAPLDLRGGNAGRVVWLIVVTTAITAALGIAFEDPLQRLFGSVTQTAIQLIVTGVLLLFARERGRRTMERMSWMDAALIGLMQAISILPGISRSGTTIVAALWLGVSREDAARYSFLASVPIITGASLYALWKDRHIAAQAGYGTVALIAGFVVSLIFGVLAIRWLVQTIRRGRLVGFAYYCWAAGAAMLALALASGGR